MRLRRWLALFWISGLLSHLLIFLIYFLIIYSAGSEPATEIHPMAVKEMGYRRISIKGQYPKDLTIFLDLKFDYIISTCEKLDAKCPTFPGDPEKIHWFFPDPAEFEGGYFAQQAEFGRIAQQLENRIMAFISLPQE